MIELKNITKIYKMGKAEVAALRDVSLQITPGEFIAIIGPSGSGKSTLLHILGFLDRPDSGSYCLEKRETTKLSDDKLAILRNSLAGFIFQQFHLLPRITAEENAELPLIYAGRHHLKEKAREKIKEVGLMQRASHRPNELSGGEQQRVAIARSLVNEPLIILADEPTGNLDTKSAEDIMSILENLNQKGKTIIMVTHEKEIAQRAKRIITIRDGMIISDERIKPKVQEPFSIPQCSVKENHSNEASIAIDNILSQEYLAIRKAAIVDHFRQAIHVIISHKMRSILSMLGVLIGIASVVAMFALGQGAKESISQRLSFLGSNLLTVRPGSRQRSGVAPEAGPVTRFTLADSRAIAKLPEVKNVSPVVFGHAQLIYGNRNWSTQVQGTGVGYAPMRASIPTIGRFFTEEELRMRQRVALLGTTVAEELFGSANPVGTTIRINRTNFLVLGVLPEKGADPRRDLDDIVIIPVTTAMYRLLGKRYVDSIDVEIRDSSLLAGAQEAIHELIVKRHRLNEEDEDSFWIRNMTEIQEAVEGTARTMTWLLGSIAAISLLVGGIGIMSIMLVSVTERTREIGLRKAIGARAKDIRLQFLIESVVMTFSGGIMGIIFGIAMAGILTAFAGWPTTISVSLVVLAATFSITVGICFGLWPACQAAKLNPVEALRYE